MPSSLKAFLTQDVDLETLPICRGAKKSSSNQLAAFEAAMDSAAAGLAAGECHCPPDCQKTVYEMKVIGLCILTST